MANNTFEDKQHHFPLSEDMFFNCLADVTPQIFSFIDPDTYQIQYINKVEQGYNISDVTGKKIFDYLLPEHVDLYREKIEEVKKTGGKAILEVGFQSFKMPLGVTWCQTTISGVYNKDNTLKSLLIFSEDISESKLLEIENNNQSEHLKAIINNTKDYICSIDLNYNVIEFNNVLALSVKQRLNLDMQSGMSVLDFLHPSKHEKILSIYERVKKGEIVTDIENYPRPDGTSVYNETSFHPIYNSEEKISGINVLSRDITERFESDLKIKNALKEKEILLAEIHHRIKNNLAMVSSLLQLKELNIDNIEAKDILKSSRERIKTTALIHELLYRNETFHDINIKDFISELFNLLKINDNIELELKGDDAAFNLTTMLPLGLILNEIMMNSFKYSYRNSKSGKTSISITIESKTLTIEYCDCQGAFPETIDFDTYNSTGLTLIHTFVEQLNGQIKLVSNVPPKYKIQIPLNDEH